MNHAPLKPPHCPMCGGGNLTAATMFKQPNTSSTVPVVAAFREGEDTVHAQVNRCRLCLDCGFVLLLLSAAALNTVRQQIAGLVAITD